MDVPVLVVADIYLRFFLVSADTFRIQHRWLKLVYLIQIANKIIHTRIEQSIALHRLHFLLEDGTLFVDRYAQLEFAEQESMFACPVSDCGKHSSALATQSRSPWRGDGSTDPDASPASRSISGQLADKLL
ncbi:hypothetical protein RHDC3_02544 [Rhodocyclaceae bacterium]|nr:hypothetical protein RHDC3_02544 [Rhodocyclaceae bacterium]